MSVTLALVDWIPVILFIFSTLILLRDLYGKLTMGPFTLTGAGMIMVITASSFKAIWKLVYCMRAVDLYLLDDAFLPLQAAGYLLLGIGMTAGITLSPNSKNLFAAVPAAGLIPQERGTVLFIGLMVLGLAGFCSALICLSLRLKKRLAACLYGLTFVLLMAMGYVGSRGVGLDARMNWISEGISCCAMLCLLAGTQILHTAMNTSKDRPSETKTGR